MSEQLQHSFELLLLQPSTYVTNAVLYTTAQSARAQTTPRGWGAQPCCLGTTELVEMVFGAQPMTDATATKLHIVPNTCAPASIVLSKLFLCTRDAAPSTPSTPSTPATPSTPSTRAPGTGTAAEGAEGEDERRERRARALRQQNQLYQQQCRVRRLQLALVVLFHAHATTTTTTTTTPTSSRRTGASASVSAASAAATAAAQERARDAAHRAMQMARDAVATQFLVLDLRVCRAVEVLRARVAAVLGGPQRRSGIGSGPGSGTGPGTGTGTGSSCRSCRAAPRRAGPRCCNTCSSACTCT